MALLEDLRQSGLDATDKPRVLRWISALPIAVNDRMRMLREYERVLSTALDPKDFATAMQGRYL